MNEWSLFGYLFHLFYLTPEEICRECMAVAPIPPATEPIIERIIERIETVRFVEREYSLSESTQLVLEALWKIMYTREAILIAAISTTIITAVLAAWTLCSRCTKRHNNTRPLHMTLSDSGGRHRYLPAVPNGNIAAPIDDPHTPYPVINTSLISSATPGPHLAPQCPPITINNNNTTTHSSTFIFNDQSYQFFQEFLAMRQEVDESVADFAKRLEDAARIGLGHMPEAGREFMLYRGFIDGILDHTLREELTKFRIYSGYTNDNERPSMTKVVHMATRFEREVLKERRKESALACQPTYLASSSNHPAAIQHQHDNLPTTTQQLTSTTTDSTTSLNVYAVKKRRRRRRRKRVVSSSSQESEANNARIGLLMKVEDMLEHHDSGTLSYVEENSDVSQHMRRAVPTHQLAASLPTTHRIPYRRDLDVYKITDTVNQRSYLHLLATAANWST